MSLILGWPRGSRWRAPAAALALAALLALTLLPAAPAGALPSQPSCEVVLDLREQTAHPSATTADTLVFSGSINATLGSVSGSRNMAILTDVAPSAWAAAVAPQTENISGTERVFFNATVAVPAASDASTRGTLTVSASFQVFPGVPSSTVACADSASITVAQYYKVDGDTSTPRITVTAGPTGTVATFIVRNLGNGRDTFTAELEDPLLMEDIGIHTNLPLRVTLEPNAETNLTIIVNASGAAKEDTYDMQVGVKSDTKPQDAFDLVTFAVQVKSGTIIPPLPDFTTLLLMGAVAATLIGAYAFARGSKRKRAAREARLNLRRLRDQRFGGLKEGVESAALPEAAQDAGTAGEAPLAPEAPRPKVRVRVKAPPRP